MSGKVPLRFDLLTNGEGPAASALLLVVDVSASTLIEPVVGCRGVSGVKGLRVRVWDNHGLLLGVERFPVLWAHQILSTEFFGGQIHESGDTVDGLGAGSVGQLLGNSHVVLEDLESHVLLGLGSISSVVGGLELSPFNPVGNKVRHGGGGQKGRAR